MDYVAQHYQTARYVAAWFKAYGVLPSRNDLAPLMGVTPTAASHRLAVACRAGLLRRNWKVSGRYEPVWRLLPEYLRERRPMLERPQS